MATVCAEPSHEPGDRFYEAYQLWNSAEKLEQAGEKDTALKKYLAARDLLAAFSTNFPTWNPEIVAYRKERVAAALTRLGQPGATAPNATEPASTKATTDKPDDLNALQLDNATKDQIIANLTAKVETPGAPQPLSGEEILSALKTRSDELARRIATLSGQPNALDPATQDALKRAGAELDTLSSAKAMAAIANTFDLICEQYKTKWLPAFSKIESAKSDKYNEIWKIEREIRTCESEIAELEKEQYNKAGVE
ncbi:MAG: hypothetical protein EBZ48_17460, partial [Proteobacteria bacterium]|nr:hypothetical protein [Pseudomonadota bacterium]